jgi:hypothetical protein
MKKMMIVTAFFAAFFSSHAEYFPGWWKTLVFESIPTNDYGLAAAALRQQERSVSLLSNADYGAADGVDATNLWTKLAVLHGDIRSKRIENPPPVFRNFGIMTNLVQLQQRMAENEAAKKICSYESVRSGLEERIESVFSKASRSGALSSFSTSERNAIVSNIVDLARFTPDEAASLGLTNVVLRSNIVERARLTEAEAHTVFGD